MKIKNKKRVKIALLYYALIIIIILLAYATYSKYISIVTGEAQIDTAKFSFKVENTTQNIELNLSNTLSANAYSENKIVPGTNGVITLNLDFSNIEVATNYTIYLDAENTIIPENLKLYTTQANTVEFSNYSGTTNLNSQTITRNIYWKWNYTTTDETEDWMGEDIIISLKIIAEQRNN